MDWLYTLSGFAVGGIVGLTGVGGGSLMTPLRVQFRRSPNHGGRHQAALRRNHQGSRHRRSCQKNYVDWRTTGRLACGSIPASLLTIWALSFQPTQSPATTHIIAVSLSIALVLTACVITFRPKLQRYGLSHTDDSAPTKFQAPITVLVGVLLGMLVTMSSVGGKPITTL